MNFKVIKNVINSNATYKFNVFLNMINILFTISIQVAIWKAIFKEDMVYRTSGYSIDLAYMIMYVIISSFMGIFVNTNVIERINDKIKSGEISIDLIRPISFNSLLFSESIGIVAFNFITQGPILVLVFFVFHVSVGNYYLGIFFFISLIFSMIVYYLISFCLGMIGFWYLEIWHLRRVLDGFIKIFSGAVIPLVFFPEGLIHIIKIIPFRCLYDIPISIMMNGESVFSKLHLLGIQCIWIIVLYFLQMGIYKIGIKKVEVQGG